MSGLRLYCGERVEVPGVPEGTPLVTVGGPCPLTDYGCAHDGEQCVVTAIDFSLWQFTCRRSYGDGAVDTLSTQPLPDVFAQVRARVVIDSSVTYRKPVTP